MLSIQLIAGENVMSAMENLTTDWPETPVRANAKNSGIDRMIGTEWSLKPLPSMYVGTGTVGHVDGGGFPEVGGRVVEAGVVVLDGVAPRQAAANMAIASTSKPSLCRVVIIAL